MKIDRSMAVFCTLQFKRLADNGMMQQLLRGY